MATLRPYGYSGGSIYATTSYPGHRTGYAMYYSGYYAQCGFAALFYNSTGKDIIITNIYAMVSANNGTFKAKFICQDIGTSIPNSSNISQSSWVGFERTLTNYGNTITGWTNSGTANVKIAKNHYFIAGFKTTNMSDSHWLNLARTNNASKMNCYCCEKSANSFTRDKVTGWKSQTPEIYVDYQDASQPTYINGKTNEYLEFWQGDSATFTLSGYNSQRVITANYFGISRNGSTYTVTSAPSNVDYSTTVSINGYNSASSLTLKSKHPYYNSFVASKNILKPGQSLVLSNTHSGSNNQIIKYDKYKANLINSTFINLNGNSVFCNAVTDTTSFNNGQSVTLTAEIENKSTHMICDSKTTNISLMHWSSNDINVVIDKLQILSNNEDYATLTNSTNLQDVILDMSQDRSSFNKVTVTSSNNNLKFSSDNGSTWDTSIEIDQGSSIMVQWRGAEHAQQDCVLTMTLTNDVVTTSTLTIHVGAQIDFNLIYPLSNLDVNDSMLKVISPLPLYAYNSNINNSGRNIIPANYPIKIRFPNYTAYSEGQTHDEFLSFKINLLGSFGYFNGSNNFIDCTDLLTHPNELPVINTSSIEYHIFNASNVRIENFSLTPSQALAAYIALPNNLGLINPTDDYYFSANVKASSTTENTGSINVMTRFGGGFSSDIYVKIYKQKFGVYNGADTDNVIKEMSVTDTGLFSLDGCNVCIHSSTSMCTVWIENPSDHNSIELLTAQCPYTEMQSGNIGFSIKNCSSANISQIKSFRQPLDLSSDDSEVDKSSIRTFILNYKNEFALSDIESIKDSSDEPIFNKIIDNEYPGALLYNKEFVCALNIVYTAYNENTQIGIQNSCILYIPYNIFIPPDKSSRAGQKIEYQIYDTSQSTPILVDDSIQRIIADAQRITYLYGRFTNDDTYENGQNKYENIKKHFFNWEESPNGLEFLDGKLIIDSQPYLELLLTGLFLIIDRLKNGDECHSDQVLKDKLVEPRTNIAHNCPVCWDDRLQNSRNLVEQYIEKYGGGLINIATHTASPIMELLVSVESFQQYFENINLIYSNNSVSYNVQYTDNNQEQHNLTYHLYN